MPDRLLTRAAQKLAHVFTATCRAATVRERSRPTVFQHPASVIIQIDGRELTVASQTSVAAAVLQSGAIAFRTSVTGQSRAALCGMGICYECRVSIDGRAHARSCQILCQSGMRIVTG
jgi:predicted molibdopterin-dependent oxidoreductase YjgC